MAREANDQQRSTELNNGAVAFWQSGQVVEAMTLFQMALANLRDKCRADNERCDNHQQHISAPCDSHVSCMVSQAVDSMDTCTPRDSVPIWIAHEDATSYLMCYNRAILLNTDSNCEDDAILPIVILFNIALLHHSKGLECAGDEALEQANCLYQMALGLLQKEEISSRSILLYLALLNNTAHIDAHLYRMDSMMAALERMKGILAETDDPDDQILSINEDDYTIFSMNVLCGTKNEFVIAPAA